MGIKRVKSYSRKGKMVRAYSAKKKDKAWELKRKDMLTSFKYPKGVDILLNTEDAKKASNLVWKLGKKNKSLQHVAWGKVDTNLRNGKKTTAYYVGVKKKKGV